MGRMESIAVGTAEVGAPTLAGVSSASGRGRDRNDDAVICGPTWFVIADGMGGHADGDIAIRLAVHALASHPAPGSPGDVSGCIADVDDAVREAARRSGAHGMGTTLVAAVAVPYGVAVAHVGDSRCYRLADGVLTLLTHDHSYVQELVDLGRMTADEARHHRLRHVVTRALGLEDAGRPDVVFVPAPVGRLLLCSDGLTAGLSHRTIGRVLAGVDDPQNTADRLVVLATEADGGDDVTALVVDHLGDGP